MNAGFAETNFPHGSDSGPFLFAYFLVGGTIRAQFGYVGFLGGIPLPRSQTNNFSILSSMEPPKGIKFGLDSSNINSTSCKSSSIEFEFWLHSNRLGEGVCLVSPSESIRAFSSEVIIYPGLSGELSSSICGSSGSWFIPGSGSRFACEENWNLMRESFS